MTATTEPIRLPAVPARRLEAWRRGRVIAAFAVLTALLLLAHPLVPNWPGNAGSLLETLHAQ
jgi:vancomycin resistance protein VanJ